LISVGPIADNGNIIVFSNTHCLILDKTNKGKVLAIGHHDLSNGLYSFGHHLQVDTTLIKDTATQPYFSANVGGT